MASTTNNFDLSARRVIKNELCVDNTNNQQIKEEGEEYKLQLLASDEDLEPDRDSKMFEVEEEFLSTKFKFEENFDLSDRRVIKNELCVDRTNNQQMKVEQEEYKLQLLASDEDLKPDSKLFEVEEEFLSTNFKFEENLEMLNNENFMGGSLNEYKITDTRIERTQNRKTCDVDKANSLNEKNVTGLEKLAYLEDDEILCLNDVNDLFPVISNCKIQKSDVNEVQKNSFAFENNFESNNKQYFHQITDLNKQRSKYKLKNCYVHLHQICTNKKKSKECNSADKIKMCKESLTQKNNFTVIKSKTKSNTLLKCNVCKKHFNQCDMKTHTGKKPYKCYGCEKFFIQRYKCDICEKFFSRSDTLKLHMKTHTDENPNRCNICGKCFSLRINLNFHIKIHTGEKPYICDICGKLFSQKFILNRHMKAHTGEKPYKCDICGKLFSQKCNLDGHLKTHG